LYNELLESMARGTTDEDGREGRIYGAQYGLIKDVSDPDKLGRVKARIGSMRSDQLSNWLSPAWPGSLECIPRKEDPCFVLFVDGDPHRGLYLWAPSTKTKSRPTEAAMLGSMMAAMYNDLVAKFNNLKSLFNSHTHGYIDSKGAAAVATPSVTVKPGATAPLGTGPDMDTDADAAKVKGADGSAVAAKSSSEVVLSKSVKVGP